MKMLTVTIGILLFGTLFGEIKEIHEIKEIEAYVSGPMTNRDWILFDVDYTLTEPNHVALQMRTIKQNKQRYLQEITKFSKEQNLLLPIFIITQYPSKLTDPLLPELIENLQLRGATVMGFTAADTAAITEKGDIPKWRYCELKRLGITFLSDKASADLPTNRIEFPHFESFRGAYPLYQDGILFSNVIPSKGPVLGAFFDKLQCSPTRVIFIDDSLKNLQSVEKELTKRGIPFLGLHYRVQVDKTTPAISEKEWNRVWENIRERLNNHRDEISAND